MSDAGQADQPQAEGADPNPDLHKIARWVAEIDLYDRETAKWHKQAKRIIKRYKDDRGDQDSVLFGARFNAFWANVQTMRPSLYAKNPKPDIQRRFKDADPVGRVTSDVLERCISYFTDSDRFYEANQQAVTDYLLPGRGTTWERYVPHMKKAPELAHVAEISDDATTDAEVPEVVDYEESITDYVHMKDFGHNVCRVWSEVWCGWRIVFLDRRELVDRFKDKGKTVPLDYVQKDLNGEKLSDGESKASIYELWDKARKVAVWFHKDIAEALDVRPDPLGLENFFPFPKPLLTNLANDSLIPTPDYIESQDQYLELDDLTTRIASLTKAVKAAGVYDASAEGLARLLNEGVENKLIPVENFAILAEKGGLANAISWLPLKDITDALLALYQARDKVKEDLHEISGMPDIARGDSDARETLGAQQIKASFAINRISDKQRDVQRFVRESIRLKADVICGHFQLETIKQISGVRLFTAEEKQQIKQYQQIMAQQPPPQPGMPPQPMLTQPPAALNGLSQDQIENMMNDPSWEEVDGLLRNNAMRCFRIDIETDSTIKADEEADKASRIEFITAIGKYMAEALPAAQQTPELAPFLLEGLQFLARGFPVGKNMESALSTAVQKLEKAAANPQPRPDPEMVKVQGEQQLAQTKMQTESQMDQQRLQAEQQLNHAKIAGEIQVQQTKVQADTQIAREQQAAQAQQAQQQNQLEAEREQRKLQQEMQITQLKLSAQNELELAKAHVQQQTAIEVARIGAKATAGEEEEAEASARVDQDTGPVKDDELHAKLDRLMQHLGQPQPDVAGAINNLAQAHGKTAEGIANLHKAVTSEKEIVRDPKTNRPTGVRIKADPKDLASQLRN